MEKPPPVEAPVAPLVEPRYRAAFATATTLFFSWALAAALNDVLIRQFRKALDLSRIEASLVQSAFYLGYFCAALPAGLLIRRWGYKPVMLGALTLYAGGALLFWPAAAAASYPVFLAALYLIAIGLAALETAANPFIAGIGPAHNAASRLAFAQAFYGLGAIAGGLIGAHAIFVGREYSPDQIARLDAAAAAAVRALEIDKVVGPYLGIAAFMAVVALAIAATRFPLGSTAPTAPTAAGRRRAGEVLRGSPRLQAAVAAQFCYVGGQVGVWSFFIDFVKDQAPWTSERDAALLLTATLALLTIGRFLGAGLGRWAAAHRLLALFAAANVLLCVLAATLAGTPAVAALLLTSFFMSIMYPTIFALGIEGLNEDRDVAAGFLVMAIIGGAAAPLAIGAVADAVGHVHGAMLVPGACFAAVLAFALMVPRLCVRAAR